MSLFLNVRAWFLSCSPSVAKSHLHLLPIFLRLSLMLGGEMDCRSRRINITNIKRTSIWTVYRTMEPVDHHDPSLRTALCICAGVPTQRPWSWHAHCRVPYEHGHKVTHMVIKQKNRNSTPTQSSHRQDTHGDWRIKRTPTQNKSHTHTYRLHALLSSSGLAVACEEGPGRQPIVVQQTDDHNYHYSHHHNYDYYLNKLQFSCKTRNREKIISIFHTIAKILNFQ